MDRRVPEEGGALVAPGADGLGLELRLGAADEEGDEAAQHQHRQAFASPRA